MVGTAPVEAGAVAAPIQQRSWRRFRGMSAPRAASVIGFSFVPTIARYCGNRSGVRYFSKL